MYGNAYGGNPPQQSQEGPQVNKKIWKVFAKDKVIDFRDNLHYAKIEDFANIHGVGGSRHAPNSTILVVLCDYTKGKGDKSVNVKYRLEVEDIEILYEAAKKAYFGELSGQLIPGCAQALERLRMWMDVPMYPDGSRPIGEGEIVMVGQMLRSALEGQKFSYTYEKNDPYKEENGLVPVQKITISYNAFTMDGQESRYPWLISIENFKAPLVKMGSGASYHKSKQGSNRKSANIMMSKVDFLQSMVAVKRYIHNWEALYRGTMNEALFLAAEQSRIRRESQQNGSNAAASYQGGNQINQDPNTGSGNYGGYSYAG